LSVPDDGFLMYAMVAFFSVCDDVFFPGTLQKPSSHTLTKPPLHTLKSPPSHTLKKSRSHTLKKSPSHTLKKHPSHTLEKAIRYVKKGDDGFFLAYLVMVF
jgi:hypothetical protein